MPGLNADGSLQAPERWGGIQRALLTTDFELSNVEYIQFWMMDPFNDDSDNNTGGELYFNLGSISEDLLNDGQLAFENGLPSPTSRLQWSSPTGDLWRTLRPSTWSMRLTTARGLQPAGRGTGRFELSGGARILRGLVDQPRGRHLGSGGLRRLLRADPSADDFRYFRDPVAQANEENVLERYRFFNGYEGNSNTAQPEGTRLLRPPSPTRRTSTKTLTLSAD